MVLESNFEFRSTGVTFLMVMDSDYLTKWQIINQIVVLVTLLLGHEGVHGIVLKKTPLVASHLRRWCFFCYEIKFFLFLAIYQHLCS